MEFIEYLIVGALHGVIVVGLYIVIMKIITFISPNFFINSFLKQKPEKFEFTYQGEKKELLFKNTHQIPKGFIPNWETTGIIIQKGFISRLCFQEDEITEFLEDPKHLKISYEEWRSFLKSDVKTILEGFVMKDNRIHEVKLNFNWGAFFLPVIWSFCFGQRKAILLSISIALTARCINVLGRINGTSEITDYLSLLIDIGNGIFIAMNTKKFIIPYKLNNINTYQKHQKYFLFFAIVVNIFIFLSYF